MEFSLGRAPGAETPTPILYNAPGAPRRPQFYTMPPALHAAPNFGGKNWRREAYSSSNSGATLFPYIRARRSSV